MPDIRLNRRLRAYFKLARTLPYPEARQTGAGKSGAGISERQETASCQPPLPPCHRMAPRPRLRRPPHRRQRQGTRSGTRSGMRSGPHCVPPVRIRPRPRPATLRNARPATPPPPLQAPTPPIMPMRPARRKPDARPLPNTKLPRRVVARPERRPPCDHPARIQQDRRQPRRRPTRPPRLWSSRHQRPFQPPCRWAVLRWREAPAYVPARWRQRRRNPPPKPLDRPIVKPLRQKIGPRRPIARLALTPPIAAPS